MICKTEHCKNLIKFAKMYLVDECHPMVIVGAADQVNKDVKFLNLDPRIAEWANEWMNMAHKNWVEWGIEKDRINDDEFKACITLKLFGNANRS